MIRSIPLQQLILGGLERFALTTEGFRERLQQLPAYNEGTK